jgi:hypothetical protein
MHFAESVRSHGAPKITMDSGERDYQQMLRSARREANPFEVGVQEVFDEGAGEAVKASRTRYGNVNVMPQKVMEGSGSNFDQADQPGNAPLEDPKNQTGTVDLSASATKTPGADPEEFETAALDRRLAMYAKAGSNANFSNNNRYQTGSL